MPPAPEETQADAAMPLAQETVSAGEDEHDKPAPVPQSDVLPAALQAEHRLREELLEQRLQDALLREQRVEEHALEEKNALLEKIQSMSQKQEAEHQRMINSHGHQRHVIRDMEDVVAEHEAELTSLRKELSMVSNEANSKIDAANDRIRAVRKERDDAIERTKVLEAENSTAATSSENEAALMKQMQHLQNECAQNEMQHLQNEVHRLADENRDLLEKNGQSVTTIAAREADMRFGESQNMLKQRRIDALEAKCGILEGAAKNKDTMEATFTGKEVELSTLQASSQRQLAEIDSLRSKLDTISAEANHKIDAANDRIRAVKRERDDVKQECDLLKSQYSHLSTSIDAQNGQSKNSSAKLESEVKAFEKRDSDRVAEIDRLRAQIKQLENQLTISVGTQPMMNAQGRQPQKVEELTGEVGMLTDDNNRLKDTVAGLEEEVGALREQKDALMEIVEGLHNACISADAPHVQEIGRASIVRIQEFKVITPSAGTPRNMSPRGAFGLN